MQTDSVLFLIFSLTFIATVLYLPHHVQFVLSRAWFYMHGDAQDAAVIAAGELAKSTAAAVTRNAAEVTAGIVREL